MMVSMVFVTLMIDLLRYKAVIVIQAICGACVYAILSICTSFTSIVVVEILYGIFTAAEVGYSTYIYSVVEVKYYQKVTSYMRAALLMGHFFSSIMAQVSISIKLFNVYQLNFFTFASLTAGTFWTIILLPSKRKLSKHETEMIPMNVDEETLKEVIFYPKDNDDCDKKTSLMYFKSMINEYKSIPVLKWSFWMIAATCCFNQVLSYIQSFWESLSHNNCFEENCVKYSEWNGAVDAIYTVISFGMTILCGTLTMDIDKYSNIIILISAIIQWMSLYTSVIWNSIYISYINFIFFCMTYQVTMTIASAEIAKFANRDRHGFIFGLNNLLAAILQSLATFTMSSMKLSTSSKTLFMWMGNYCFFIAVCFFFIVIVQIVR
ncbi:folate transporter 1-like isoform X2 [Daktulosphaira vitifoliae]|nr:folate transporter 1-like isoform X2 [Daktulosphaira vitifoliae]